MKVETLYDATKTTLPDGKHGESLLNAEFRLLKKNNVTQKFVKLTHFRTQCGTVWKSRQKYDHDFYGKMKLFSVKLTQK